MCCLYSPYICSSIVRTVGEPTWHGWHGHVTARGQWGHSRVTDQTMGRGAGDLVTAHEQRVHSGVTDRGQWRVPPGKTIGRSAYSEQ